jgi:capsule polysaccharide modification protein KpsS
VGDLKGKRVLLLQGPNGPFFRRLYDELRSRGAEVEKVCLSAAEQLYFLGRETLKYRGTWEEWPAFLRDLAAERRFDVCFLFGDCRPYHAVAIPILKELGVKVLVFEDGYLRPHYITVEQGGVNSRSPLRHNAPRLDEEPRLLPPPEPVSNAFGWSVLHTIINSLAVTLGRPLYPHYVHHRDVNTLRQALLWGRSGLRFAYFKLVERSAMERIQREWAGRYFLVGLQVFNDSQIQRSRFRDVGDFVTEIVRSFARHAPADTFLVFKHHPADRAYRNYASLIRRQSVIHGVEGRVRYIHDQHLPTLLKGARGTVVINSTVGWSSLHHGTPVHTSEETVYGYFGLTAPGSLDEFWQEQPKVDTARVARAEAWLRLHNQANGSVWTRLNSAGPSGVIWPPEFEI